MSILKKEPGGKTGLKRTLGFVLIGVAVVLAVVDQFTSFKVNFAVWSSLLGLGGLMIGASAIPKLNK